ncbi:MAG: deoxyribonuclease V [Gammaproteobacteria bacterium]
MHNPPEHPWDVSPAEGIAIQKALRPLVVCDDRLGEIRHVAGVDIGFPQGRGVTRAAVAVLDYPGLELADHAVVEIPTRFPYVPGLLSFREIPAVLEALSRLEIQPDLLLCDGQGIAHPRRLGIASHLGLVVDTPSIGVAKSRLIGHHTPLPDKRGAWVPLVDEGETVGAVLRTRKGVKPLYVSPGHRVSLPTSVKWVMRCTTRFRLPETTRKAHHLASAA